MFDRKLLYNLLKAPKKKFQLSQFYKIKIFCKINYIILKQEKNKITHFAHKAN